jgi:hypothetical protein
MQLLGPAGLQNYCPFLAYSLSGCLTLMLQSVLLLILLALPALEI